MANITIPNLPATAAVDGTEQLEAVQNGTSVRVTAAQIASLAQNTQGTVTQIDTAGALVGGPITTTGTISLPPDAVTNVYLAEMPANTLKANLTGLTANPTDVTPSALLNTFGSAAGSMLYRDAGVWTALGPGTPGFYLTTTGNQPQWTALSVSPGDIQPSGVSPGTYGNASNVGQFTVAASGQITFANNIPIVIPAGQVTGLGTMAVQNANNVAITGGTMDGVVIGSTSAAQAYFTTIAQGTWNGATIGIAYGGTGATTAATARTNLGLGTMAVQDANNVAITGGTIDGVTIGGGGNPQAGTFTSLTVSGTSAIGTVTSGSWNGNPIPVAYGGTGANNASVARLNLGAAASGANSDITSLSGLTTPLSAPQGGTGFASYTPGDLLYATASNALGRLNDVAAGNVLKSGGVGLPPAYGKVDVTADITGILTVPNGGTGAATLTGYVYGNGTSVMTASPTIPTTALDYNSVTIGSTVVALGGSAPALAGVTSLTLTQDPTQALQAATKQYVDYEVATVSNLTYHTQVDATTTANLNANYNNGASGVGATLTNAGAFAQFSIDNYTPGSQARVLIKDQTNAAQNGIYVVTTQGDAISVPWVLTRASDFNTPAAGPNGIQAGASVFVQNGQTWGSTSWVMTTTGAITVGTTPLVWTQISSSGNITVTSPLAKVGNVISLGTVPVTLGGTGLTSYTVGDLVYANTTTSLAPLSDVATGNVLRSGGVNNPPAWGKLDLTTDVTGVLPVANGGTGTSTALTSGSVVFAGASGVFSQNNANFFWDNVNTRLGIHTSTPDASLTILSETQTALPPGALPSGTDFHIVGANNADARITQDAFGSGNYPAYTGRHARGTAALPTASQTGDILSQFTGRGYGASAYNSASTGILQFVAAENFTNTAQGTYASLRLTATGAASPTEVMRFGPLGQLGVGGASYGTANQLLTSGGSGAAPSWQSGINVTTIDASGAINFTTLTDNISIGASQTSGLLTLGGTAQTANVVLAPSTKTFTLSMGGGVTESGATKTINLGTAGASSSTTAINIGASAAGSSSTTTLYGNVKVNGLTASKPVFTDASSNLTSSGTLLTDQGGTGLTSYTVGDLLYFSAGTALTKLGIGTNGQILTSNGTVPVWTSGSSISVNTATNLAGGATGSVPYQSAASTTTFLSIGAANTVMTSSGTAPQWVTSLTGLTGVSSSSITNTSLTSGRVVYSTTGGLQTDSTNLCFNGTTLTAGCDALISGLTVGRGAGALASNTAVGANALLSNTTGCENSAFGQFALYCNTSGCFNTSAGSYALRSNTTALNNTAVGYAAMYTNTSGTGTAFGANALYFNTTGTDNAAFGAYALCSNTTGTDNSAFGRNTLVANTTGANNVAVGRSALQSNTTASGNTALGYFAACANTTGTLNTAVGNQAMQLNTTGCANTAVGSTALYGNTSGQFNTAVGREALVNNTTGSCNTAHGAAALFANTTASANTAVGYQAGYCNTTGTGLVAVGLASLAANTTGNYNTGLGFGSLQNATTGSNNTAIGGDSMRFGAVTGCYNTAVGFGSLTNNTTGSNNTAVGYQAAYSNTTAGGGTIHAFGFQALYSNTTGANNVGLGNQALYSNSTGNNNVAVGGAVACSNTTGSANAAFGHNALFCNTTGSNNTVVGFQALLCNTTASNNTAVGYQAGFNNTTGANNTFLGFTSGYYQQSASGNTALGMQTLQGSSTPANNTGINNVAVGLNALNVNSSGSSNTAVGKDALLSNTTASNNTAVGYQAALYNTTGENNVALGRAALINNTTASANTALGDSSLRQNTTGATNTAVGVSALYSNTTASCNTAVGYQAGYGNTTGFGTTAVGYRALACNSTSIYNTAVGGNALENNTAADNTAVGFYAMQGTTSGTENVAVGTGALQVNTTGGYNIAVGRSALLSNTTGSYNVAVGRQALYSNTTSAANTAVGYQAAYNNTAADVTAVGFQAAYSNTTGNYLIAIGGVALCKNTTGVRNVAVGYQALLSNTTASYNTAIGMQTLSANTTGSNNTAAGNEALVSNTTGANNIAIGYQSLFSNTVSSNNTAVGHQALLSNTSAGNTAVGFQAGYGNTSGSGSSYFGNLAGCAVTTGTQNTLIGDRAGFSTTTASNNTAVGNQALYTATGGANTAVGQYAANSLSTGTNNTFIGQTSGNLVTTGSKNTILGSYNGNQNGLDIRTASNRIVISDGDGNPRLWTDSNGYLYLPPTNFQNIKVSQQGAPNLGTYKGYLLLAKAYVSGLQNVSSVNGTFFLSRGGAGSGNRSDVYQVNSQSGYNAETLTVNVLASTVDTFFVRTVKVTYGGVVYHAIETTQSGGEPNNGIWFQGVVNGDTGAFPIYTDASYVSSITDYGYAQVSGRDGTQSLYLQNGRLEFPATQNASSNANTLDDYEEGTFTPTLRFGGATTGITYNNRRGTYTKIGNNVTVQFGIYLSSKGSATGAVTVIGLPFTSKNQAFGSYGGTILFGTNGFTSVTGVPFGIVNENSSDFYGYIMNNGTESQLTDANMGNTTYFQFTMTYQVD